MNDTRPDIPLGYTYNKRGQELTYKDSSGYWYEHTYNNQGKELTFKTSTNFFTERTYNDNGQILTFKDSDGRWYEYFYDIDVFVDTPRVGSLRVWKIDQGEIHNVITK